jgi:hypothetical protein
MKKNYLPLLLLGGAALALFAFKKKPKGKVIVPTPEKLTEGEFKKLTEVAETTAPVQQAQVDYIAPKVVEKAPQQVIEQMISPVSEEVETVTLPSGQKVKRKKAKATKPVAPIEQAIKKLSTGQQPVNIVPPTIKKAEPQKILKKEVSPVAKKPAPVIKKHAPVAAKPLPVAKKPSVPALITKAVATKKPVPVAKKPAPVVKKTAPVAAKPLPVAKKPSVPASITKAVAPKTVAKPVPKAIAPVNIVAPKPVAKAASTFIAPKPIPVAAKPVVKAASVVKKPLPIAAKGKKVGEFPIYG